MLLASALVIQIVQGIVPHGETPARDFIEKEARSSILYFISLFEIRFTSKSQRKGQVKDPEVRVFLTNFTEDVIFVLNLPSFPVAELILFQLAERLEYLAKDATKLGLCDTHRSTVTEVLCMLLARLAKHKSIAARDLTLGDDFLLLEIMHAGEIGSEAEAVKKSGDIERALEDQQQQHCKYYAGTSTNVAFQSPIKRAQNSCDREELLTAQLQQSVLNSLSRQLDFEPGSMSHSAHLFHSAMWSSSSEIADADSSPNGDFWWSQGTAVFLGRVKEAVHVLELQRADAGSFWLSLKRPLLSNLRARCSLLLPLLMESRYVLL